MVLQCQSSTLFVRNDGGSGGGDNNDCELLGPFALVIQGCLGLLALGSLVWKRYHEHPHRRPWIIWFYDVSKQVFGASLVHILNLFLSILRLKLSTMIMKRQQQQEDNDDPCDYYFLNILFDTTIGIPILYIFITLISICFSSFGIKGIRSGEYGNPPLLKNYLKQLIIYMLSLSMMKITIYYIMINIPILVKLAIWLLSRLDNYPNLQVSFVLLIFPLIMNTFQYYVVDNLIQSRKYYAVNKLVQNMGLENEIEEDIPEDISSYSDYDRDARV